MKIKEIPKEMRPREKAIRFGISKLENKELLSLIIGSGVAGSSAIDISETLIKENCYSLSNLVENNYESLLTHKGLKENNALKLLAAFELHKRVNAQEQLKDLKIINAEDVYTKYKYLENLEQEVFIVLFLDAKFNIKKEKTLYKGTFNSLSLNINEVIKELILSNCKQFILIHNHPDQSSEPSSYDLLSTKSIEKSAKNLSIKMIDHIIIFKNGYHSFRLNKTIKLEK